MKAACEFDVQWLTDTIRDESLSIGIPLSWKDETVSTNDDAIHAAKSGAPHGALFVADRQTQGRGRVGRPWFSPAEETCTPRSCCVHDCSSIISVYYARHGAGRGTMSS